MDFEFTITDTICVERTDFNKMKKLVRDGLSYEQAFEEVASEWDDYEWNMRNYIKDDVIKELKRRLNISY